MPFVAAELLPARSERSCDSALIICEQTGDRVSNRQTVEGLRVRYLEHHVGGALVQLALAILVADEAGLYRVPHGLKLRHCIGARNARVLGVKQEVRADVLPAPLFKQENGTQKMRTGPGKG